MYRPPFLPVVMWAQRAIVDGLGIDVDVGDLFGDEDAGDDDNENAFDAKGNAAAVEDNSGEGGEGIADCDGIDLDADDLFGGEEHGNDDDADDGPAISHHAAADVAVPTVGEEGMDDDVGGLFFDFE